MCPEIKTAFAVKRCLVTQTRIKMFNSPKTQAWTTRRKRKNPNRVEVQIFCMDFKALETS
jgi:ribosomal protein L33